MRSKEILLDDSSFGSEFFSEATPEPGKDQVSGINRDFRRMHVREMFTFAFRQQDVIK
jgi:hypothetical protein